MANLYAIRDDIESILEHGFIVDTETGEIDEADIADKLAALEIAEADKLENTALYIKNLAADISAIKTEEKALAERRRAKEKRQTWLEQYLTGFMQATNREAFGTARCALSFRKSTSLSITDEGAVKEYAKLDDSILRYKDPEINKAVVTQQIKAGTNIPGAALVERQNLQIK